MTEAIASVGLLLATALVGWWLFAQWSCAITATDVCSIWRAIYWLKRTSQEIILSRKKKSITYYLIWVANIAIRLSTMWTFVPSSHGSHWCYASFKWPGFGLDSMVAGSEFTGQSTQMRTLQPSNGFKWEKWRSRGRISMVCIRQVILSSKLPSKIASVNGEMVGRQTTKEGEGTSSLVPPAYPSHSPSPLARFMQAGLPLF